MRLHHVRATAPQVNTRGASAISSKRLTLLLRMRRSKVDVVRAQAAVDAMRSGAMSYRAASEAYSFSVSSIAKRLKGEVRMNASVGAATVLSLEEENSTLIWAAHRYLGVGWLELRQAVTKLFNDGRNVPLDHAKSPGRK